MLRSRFLRLAIIMTLVPTLILILVGFLGYERMRAQHTSAYDLRLNDEIAALAQIYSESGEDELKWVILQRMAMYPSGRDHISYGLFINQINVLDSSLEYTPPTDGFIEKAQQRWRVTPLSSNVSLATATTINERSKTLATLQQDLSIAVLLCLITSFVLGLLCARAFVNRLKSVNALIDKVAEGNVQLRLPVDKSGDEITFLSLRINTMLTRIEHLLKVRKRISDQVAHEVRTPLTQLDSALRQILDEPNKKAHVVKARSDLQNCIELLEGLLDVSSLEAQLGDSQGFSLIELSTTAIHIAEFYEPLAEEKGVTFSYDFGYNSHIFADAAQIERLVANLLDNAIKYTPSGGRVSISIKCDSQNVSFCVSDTGIGINSADKDSIFEPFFRHIDSSLVKGHGLGLSLAKAIAERHNAKITVSDNIKNTGSCFEVKFERASGE